MKKCPDAKLTATIAKTAIVVCLFMVLIQLGIAATIVMQPLSLY